MKHHLFILICFSAHNAMLWGMEKSSQKWESISLKRQQVEEARLQVERERQQLRKDNAIYTLLTAFPSNYEAAHDVVREFPEVVNTYVKVPSSFSGWSQGDQATPIHFCSDHHMLEILLNVPGANCHLLTKKDRDTVLHRAANKQVARLFIRKGVSVNQANKWGGTPVSRALAGKDDEYAHYLVANGALVDSCDQSNNSLILSAVTLHNKKKASFLLQHGADPMKQNNLGDTAISLLLSGRNSSMIRCFAKNGWFIYPEWWELEYNIDKLLRNNAFLLKQLRHDKSPLLSEAIATLSQFFVSMFQRQSDKESKVGFVLNGCYFNNVSRDALSTCYGDATLLYAHNLLYGRCRCILKSLQKVKEWTEQQSRSLATTLAANPSLLMYDQELTFDLLNHSMQNNVGLFKQSLQAQVNLKGKDSDGNNLLHLAVLRRNKDAVRDLIMAGIDVTECNQAEKTAFELSRRIGCDTIFYDLIKQDFFMHRDGGLYTGLKTIIKEKNFYPNISDAKGRNLIFDVIEKEAFPQGVHLIRHGADIHYADKEGTTPLEYALAQGWSEGVELLLNSGAKVPLKLLQYAANIEYYARQKLYEEYVRQSVVLCSMCGQGDRNSVVQCCKNKHQYAMCQGCKDVKKSCGCGLLID